MRAARYHGQGDVRIEEVDSPGQAGPGDLLIQVNRAAICGTDASEFKSGPRMIPLNTRHPGSGHLGPMVLGHEFTGSVIKVGDGVEGISVGDRVVSGAGVSCGSCAWCARGDTNLCARYYTLGLNADGGMAELAVSPASICHTVPASVEDDAAAMTQPLAVAIHALEKGAIQPGENVAILGIGGIGTLMTGAASPFRAGRLIAVDVDDNRLEAARSLGADETINARREDVASALLEITGGDGVDVAFEASGTAPSIGAALAGVRRGGRVVIVGHPSGPTEIDLAAAGLREVDLIGTVAHICGRDIPEALGILEGTDLASKVLGEVIPIGDLVDRGLVPLAEGRAGGKIIVDVAA